MKIVKWAVSGFVAGMLMAAVSSCGATQGKCDITTCPTGCCNASGQCQPGFANEACGANAGACQVCTVGTVCQQGFCTGTSNLSGQDAGTQNSDAGTQTNDAGTQGQDAGTQNSDAGTQTNDAGTQGQDAGTQNNDGGTQTNDAGTPPTCTSIAAFVAANTTGGFDNSNFPVVYAELESSAAAPTDMLMYEVYNYAALPKTDTFTTATDYNTCETCLIFGQGCDNNGCAKWFLAQGGTATITTATPVATGGTLQGSAASLTFNEWDFQNDRPVAGGACVTIGASTVNATW